MPEVEDKDGTGGGRYPALVHEVRVADTSVTLLGTTACLAAARNRSPRHSTAKDYQAVAVELCASRFDALTHPERLARLDLMQGRASGQGLDGHGQSGDGGLPAASLGEQLGIEPGAEMRSPSPGRCAHGRSADRP